MKEYENELDEIRDLYEKAGTQAQKLAGPLVNEASFQAKELKKLRELIEKEGWTSYYDHGYRQHGTTQSANGKTYLTLSKVFNTTVKTLHSILDGKMPEPEDEFLKAVKK